eukprot:s24_g26.t1
MILFIENWLSCADRCCIDPPVPQAVVVQWVNNAHSVMAEDDEVKVSTDRAEGSPTSKSVVAKDIDEEISALISKARQRLEGVSKTMEDNGGKLKKLEKGFSDLKRQQAHVAREQQQELALQAWSLAPCRMASSPLEAPIGSPSSKSSAV